MVAEKSCLKDIYKDILPSGISVSYGKLAAASRSVRGRSAGLLEYNTVFKLWKSGLID